MARRAPVPTCSHCETPFRSDAAFCGRCGHPTPWATHEQRVAWEVRQWRASRARAPADPERVVLVRTERGYEPVVERERRYVWDKPLHPEREEVPEPRRPASATVPAPPEDVPAPTARPAWPPPPPESADARPRLSRKAVALGILLAVGLPLGSRAVGLVRPRSGSAPAAPAAAGGSGKPAPVAPAGSGFEQVAPDAVRYAVVVRNPNPSLEARDVTLEVTLRDAGGRPVGADMESVPAVPAGGAVGVAGAATVAGRPASIDVRVAASGFDPPRPGEVEVRGVSLRRAGGEVIVRAAVSAARPLRGARVVAVYWDAAGRIVGGDVTSADVPPRPAAATALIRAADPGRRIARAEVFVLPPR
jgi:hypothetical protein